LVDRSGIGIILFRDQMIHNDPWREVLFWGCLPIGMRVYYNASIYIDRNN